MNVSEYIIDFLIKKGINTAFVVVGGHAMFLNDALAKCKNKIKAIPSHHEQAAVMNADAYARIKNTPAIVMLTAGPGVTNSMTGVLGAYIDSAPMIVLSGQSHTHFVEHEMHSDIRQFGTQGVEISKMVLPITKYFVTIFDAKQIRYHLEKAYHLATTCRPGPVWLDVPLDIQKTEINPTLLEGFTPSYDENREIVNGVTNLYDLLQKSKRPVLMVGQGIRLAHATKEFNQLIDRLKIPVITSRLGADLIEYNHPLFIGSPGISGQRAAHFTLQNSDLLIVLGSRLSSATVGFNPKDFARNAYKFVVDIDSEELIKPGVEIDYKIHGDVKKFINLFLIEASAHSIPEFTQWAKQCHSWKEKYLVVLSEYKNEEKVNSYYFLDRLSKLSSANTSTIIDGGTTTYVSHQAWKVKRGQRIISSGIISMGWWCSSIGASIADSSVNTIALVGDGSFQMNIQELATIKHNNLPIKIFIINNNGYLLIRHTQKNFMEGRLIGESPETGLWCPDSLEIAKAYGIKGVRIHNTDELDAKIQEVLDYDGPVICDVLSPEWQLIQPKLASEKLADGTMVSKPFEDMAPFIDREELAEIMKVSDDRSEIQK